MWAESPRRAFPFGLLFGVLDGAASPAVFYPCHGAPSPRVAVLQYLRSSITFALFQVNANLARIDSNPAIFFVQMPRLLTDLEYQLPQALVS